MDTQLLLQISRELRIVCKEDQVLVHYIDDTGEHTRVLIPDDEFRLVYNVTIEAPTECIAAVAGALALGGKK